MASAYATYPTTRELLDAAQEFGWYPPVCDELNCRADHKEIVNEYTYARFHTDQLYVRIKDSALSRTGADVGTELRLYRSLQTKETALKVYEEFTKKIPDIDLTDCAPEIFESMKKEAEDLLAQQQASAKKMDDYINKDQTVFKDPLTNGLNNPEQVLKRLHWVNRKELTKAGYM